MAQRDLTGHILDGRYRVVEPVGMGAMGSVYRAEHLKLGRVVAIKFINEHVSSGMSSRARFEREALAMAKLEHPHCASVLDVGLYEDMPYVVMDFAEIDHRADLYACGVLLFELLTGVKPFRSASNEPVEVCMMHLNVPAPRLCDALPGQDFGSRRLMRSPI